MKDLRWEGLAPAKAVKQFVQAWRPRYNRRVAVPPAQAADLHRPRPASRDLDRSLCLKTTRVLRHDWTVAHHGQPLTYQVTAARPREAAGPETCRSPRHLFKPRADHPWNGYGTFAANRPAAAQTEFLTFLRWEKEDILKMS